MPISTRSFFLPGSDPHPADGRFYRSGKAWGPEMIVVDSNIIAARTLTASLSSIAERLEKNDSVWIVPTLWRYEFQNILATAIKAKQITAADAKEVWERVAGILADNESEPSPLKVLDLVARFRITAYDGQFIALAMETGVPCLTEDRPLREKFPGIAFSMHDFLNPPKERAIREKIGKYRPRKLRLKY